MASQPGGYPAPGEGPPAAGAGGRSPLEVEDELIEYVEECFGSGEEIDLEHTRRLLQSSSGPLAWTQRTEDGIPLLHLTAMVQSASPEVMRDVLTDLLSAGADPMVKDEDGDTAMDAVMSLAEDDDDDDDEEDKEDRSKPEKLTHMTAVSTLLRCPRQVVDRPLILSVCSWLRKGMPRCTARPDKETGATDAKPEVTSNLADEILHILGTRGNKDEVNSIWCSEELMEYLDKCAYDKKACVEGRRVKEFIERGALPSHSQNGASCLLLVVLNPYSTYRELDKVFRLMLTATPGVAKMRDAFKLSPMQWAADYNNVAQQHKLKRANPAAFLALLPNLLAIPGCISPDEDAGPQTGLVCLKVSTRGDCSSGTLPKGASSKPPRFLEGDRVNCHIETPGSQYDWETGVIVALWYREGCWPSDYPGAPYEVLLDIGTRIFAPADDDRIVRKEARRTPAPAPAVPTPATEASGAPAASASLAGAAGKAEAKAKAVPRFIRRQREDGHWEMLDTKSGNARPIASDSDESD